MKKDLIGNQHMKSHSIFLLINNLFSKLAMVILAMTCICSSLSCASDHAKDLVSVNNGGACFDMEVHEFDRFIKHPETWSHESLDKAFVLLDCTGGGSLEDLYDALGIYMESNATHFLEKFHSENQQDYVLETILASFSENLVENWSEILRRLNLRRSLVEKTVLPCCSYERDIAIESLSEQIKKVEKIIEDDKKSN